jgi:tRNA(His) 5'-end guanylyltransferase
MQLTFLLTQLVGFFQERMDKLESIMISFFRCLFKSRKQVIKE